MPNGVDKLNHFVAKVWDATSKSYRPIYVAPDATDRVQGDVRLSDATNSGADAATGMTAATPKAVKAVQDSANNKLDKVSGADQTVASKVTFNNAVVMNNTLNVRGAITGNLTGNASTATRLQTSRNIALAKDVTGNANFDGSGNVTIQATIADRAVTPGKLSANYAAGDVQGGSALRSNQMNATQLTNVDLNFYGGAELGGKRYFAAGGNSCLNKPSGVDAFGMLVIRNAGGQTMQLLSSGVNLYTRYWDSRNWSAWQSLVSTGSTSTSWITSSMIQNGAVTTDKVNFNYAGSSSKGGAANSAAKLSAARGISLSGDVVGGANFDGSANITINAGIANGAVTSSKIGAGQVNTTHIANGTIKAEDLNGEIGIVAVQSTRPTTDRVKLWIQTN